VYCILRDTGKIQKVAVMTMIANQIEIQARDVVVDAGVFEASNSIHNYDFFIGP
jgi:hypothetical protein